ncbi:MAG: response regulator [Butyribacter sp.]|nr:response regulator [Butyribacter sp.]
MIRVFLVEDEIVIRNGIKNSIEWEKEGYEFVGEASDGELALPMILKEKPDIVITDIRMPFMDGLEMSKLVKQELPDIKILILSGYDEFEYAKEAIKIGVTEYMLKPISSAKLLETLKEVSKQILAEREEKKLKKLYVQEMQENVELKKMKFFGQLISGELSFADAVNMGKEYNMNLSAQLYKIILFKFSSIATNDVQEESMLQAYEEMEKLVSQVPYVCSFQRSVEGWAFLLLAEQEEEMKEKEERFLEKLRQISMQHDDLPYFGGIGTNVCRLSELGNSFREADRAFAGRFTHDMNQIISPESLHILQEDEAFDANSFGELEQTHRVVEKFLNNGTQEEVQSFVEACLSEIPEDNFRSIMMRQYIIMDIYVVVMSFCEKINSENEQTQESAVLEENGEALKRAIARTETMDDIKIYIEALISQAIEVRNTASGRRYSDIIQTAKIQIENTYMSEEISLNSVAAGVGMSPSYFSSIFSREMGKTFVEYLTEIRMEKAKELLTCSSMKTSEIGYEVGYKDPHYFSYIFKKTQGCSPKEYRSSRKG